MSMGASEAPLLEAPFDAMPSQLLLGTSAALLLLSIASLLADAMPGPPPRGEAKRPERTALACALLLRICVAAAIVLSLLPGILETIRYLRGGSLASLASPRVNTWMHDIVLRTIDIHNTARPANALLGGNVGVGYDAIGPASTSIEPLAWACVLLLIVLLSVGGSVLGVFAESQSVIKGVFTFTYAHGLLWFFIALLAAFVRPTAMPQDETPLRAKWFDRLYITRPSALNERRLLSNWVLMTDSRTVNGKRTPEKIWLSDVPELSATFCNLFNAHVPVNAAKSIPVRSDTQSEVAAQSPVVAASPSVAPTPSFSSSGVPSASAAASIFPGITPPFLAGAARQQRPAFGASPQSSVPPSLEKPQTVQVAQQQAAAEQQAASGLPRLGEEIMPPLVDSLVNPAQSQIAVQAPVLSPSSLLDAPATPVQSVPSKPVPSPATSQSANESTRTTPTTTNPDTDSVQSAGISEFWSGETLDRGQLGEVLVAYVAGRGVGTGPFHALAHLAGGALVAAPAVAAQALARPIFAPAAVAWALAGIMLALRGTPTLLRAGLPPQAPPTELQVCGREYMVRVADPRVARAARADVVAVVLLFIALLVRGYAWLRIADTVAAVQETNDVKLVDYDDLEPDSAANTW